MASRPFSFLLFLLLLLLVPKRSLALTPLDELLLEFYGTNEVQQLRDGKLLQDTVESGSERELAVRFALLVNAPPEEIRQVFMSASKKKESDPSIIDLGLIEREEGSLEDFDAVTLMPKKDSMTKAYRNASPGSDLNLSQQEIDAFNELSDDEEVEQKLRSILLDRYQAYRKSGLSGIPPYRRNGGKDYHPSDDLKRKVKIATILQREAPDFHRYLTDYPNAQPDGLEESFKWMTFEIDSKPTISLVHRMGQLHGNVYVFAERHFYVSRSHNCIQGVGGAFPTEEGTVLLYLVRTTTDQVSGFGSSTKRAIGSRIMGGQMAANFERARALFASSSTSEL